jgi:glycosyltransferase involved in cell wall biosynthesis
VTAPCKWVLDSVKQKHCIDWPHKKIIFNALTPINDSDCWNPKYITEYQILFVGRFDKHKGGDLVIKAFSNVLKKFPNATLKFAGPDKGIRNTNGDTFYINDMIKSVIPIDKIDNIDYLGVIDHVEISVLRKQSHLTVIASRNENFPYTVLESLSSGSPTIAPDVGGISETLVHDDSGIFFKGGDATDLSNQICELFSQPLKLERIARKGYEHSKKQFNSKNMTEETLEFYNTVIDSRM